MLKSKTKTQQDRNHNGCIAAGWTRVRLGRHWTYEAPGTKLKIYLGRSGAVRIGRTKRESRSYTDQPEAFMDFLIKYKDIIAKSQAKS